MSQDKLPEIVAYLELHGAGADEAFEQLFGVVPDRCWKRGQPMEPQYKRAEEEDGASITVRIHTEVINDAVDALFARLKREATQAGELAAQRNQRIHAGVAVYGGERTPSMLLTREHISTLHALGAEWLDIDMSYTPWRDEAK